MVRVTCLSPMKSYSYCPSAFAHLEFLILQTSNNDPSTRSKHRANIQSKQQVQLKKYTKTKERLKKNVQKDGARCYGYENARNAENGATVEKIQLPKDLCYKRNKRTLLYLF